jgi:hypothetical protein
VVANAADVPERPPGLTLRVTDAGISADILNGDVDAFRRQARDEEDDE